MSHETVILSDQDVTALLPHHEVLGMVETVFAEWGNGNVVMPPKVNLDMSRSGHASWCNAMPAYLASSNVGGIKWVGGFGSNPAQGLPYIMGIVVLTDPETGQTKISGMGELHLDIIVDRLRREFHVNANVGAPQVAYRETLMKPVDVEGKFVRQTGGRGQYGHVKMKVEPLPRGSGIQFENAVVGGTVPKDFIPAVQKGVEEATQSGPLLGFPIVDAKFTLYDGSYHEVDSSEMAFKIAASMAVREAMTKGDATVLEPIMRVEVVTPDQYMGDVIGSLNSRRGQIQGMEQRGNAQVVSANVPLAEMFGYATDLRSLTQGRAVFTMMLDHYEPVPRNIQEELVKR